LAGVTWRLVGMIGDADAFSPVLGNVAITATFDEQNRVSGSSGCNRYTGPDTWGEGSISIGAVAGTRMMCSDSLVMAQESRYLQLLTAAGSYRVSAGIEDGEWISSTTKGLESWNTSRSPDPGTRPGLTSSNCCGKEGGSQTALLVS